MAKKSTKKARPKDLFDMEAIQNNLKRALDEQLNEELRDLVPNSLTVTSVTYRTSTRVGPMQHAHVEATAYVMPTKNPSAVLEQLKDFVEHELQTLHPQAPEPVVQTDRATQYVSYHVEKELFPQRMYARARMPDGRLLEGQSTTGSGAVGALRTRMNAHGYSNILLTRGDTK